MDYKKQLEELKAKQSYLYDLFTRAAHSKSGAILEQLCEVDTQIARLKKEQRQERQKGTN